MKPSFDESVSRFWERVDRGAKDECWPWLLKKRETAFAGSKRPITACASIATFGSLPVDKRVLHTCKNLYCVNPAHLILGTLADAVRRVHNHDHRGSKKGAKWRVRSAICPNGHVRTPQNTVLRKDGYLRCRICHRNGSARRRSAAKVPQLNALASRLLEGLR